MSTPSPGGTSPETSGPGVRRVLTRVRRTPRRALLLFLVAGVLVVALATTLGVSISEGLDGRASTTTTTSAGPSASATSTTAANAGATTGNSGSGAVATSAPQNLAPLALTPGGSKPGTGGYNAVACWSSSVCMAVGADSSGNAVAVSTGNGGDSWQSSSVPSGARDLDAATCISATSCLAVGQGSLLASADGGQTWQRRELPVAQTTLLGVTCTSGGTCLAAGISPRQTQSYEGVIIVSTDGGRTWANAKVPLGTPGLGSVACPSPTVCIAVGATVMVSSDGGQSWRQEAVNGPIDNLRTISCSSSTTCVAVGPNEEAASSASAPGEAIATTDAGATWNLETLPSDSGLVTQITCPDANHCLAAGADPNDSGTPSFISSSDGGTSWTSAAPPSGVTTVTGMACPTSGACVLVGRGSALPVSATTRDGVTWTAGAALK